MKKYRVVLLKQAVSDLKAIWLSVAQLTPVGADRLIENIMHQVENLSTFPERAQLRPDIDQDVRLLVEGKYLILYRIIGDEIEIVRVVYGGQDLTKLALH